MPSFAQLVPTGLRVVQAVDVGDEGNLGDKTWSKLSNSILERVGGREEGGLEATVQPTGLDIFGRHYGEFPALEDHGTAEDYNWLQFVFQRCWIPTLENKSDWEGSPPSIFRSQNVLVLKS